MVGQQHTFVKSYLVRLAKLLRRLADWIDQPVLVPVRPSPRLVRLRARAQELVQEFERNQLSYQTKGNRDLEILNKLSKEYPRVPTRKIAEVVNGVCDE